MDGTMKDAPGPETSRSGSDVRGTDDSPDTTPQPAHGSTAPPLGGSQPQRKQPLSPLARSNPSVPLGIIALTMVLALLSVAFTLQA